MCEESRILSFAFSAITGIDTRMLTKHLRMHGSILGKLVLEGVDPNSIDFDDPNKCNLPALVSTTKPRTYNEEGDVHIALIDCGVKYNQVMNYFANFHVHAIFCCLL